MLRKSAVRWAGSGVLRRSLPSLAAVRTYHAVFGLPFGLDVDTAALQKSYHQLQRGAHPDVAPGTGGAGTSIGAHDDGDSIEANKAYEVLRNNYRRARYVSQLIRALRQSEKKGLPGDGASAADWAEMACDHKDPEAAPLPPDFLERVMTLNEEVFALDPSDDVDAAKMKTLTAEVKKACEAYWGEAKLAYGECEDAARALVAGEATGADPSAAREAENRFHAACLRWTYYENLAKHLHERA